MSNFNNDVLNLISDVAVSFQSNKLHKRLSYRITRGRAPSLSGEFENNLAKLFERHTSNNIDLFVDTSFSYIKSKAK